MRLLIAFSNAAPDSKTLGVYDWTARTIEWIDTTWLGRGVTGFDDVLLDDDRLWLLPQSDDRQRSRLVAVDTSFRPLESIVLEAGDPHAVARIGRDLLVTDTTRNRVMRVTNSDRGWAETEYVRLSEQPVDAVHLNSICALGDVAYASCFGRRPEGGWRAASDGTIVELLTLKVRARGLRHPHSLISYDEAVYWTESQTGRIYRLIPDRAPEHLFTVPGYARGLAVTNESFYVGVSAQRTTSRSTGVRNAPMSSHPDADEAWIYRIDRQTSTLVEKRMLTEFGIEIFEIVLWNK